MADTFKFELVSPERVLLSEDAEQVVVPGVQGDFAVLPGHAPVISTLRPGVLEIRLPGGARRIFVKTGFAEVEPDRLTILAETAFDLESAGAAAAIDEQLAAAQTELEEAAGDDAQFMAQEAVDRLRRLQSARG
jgi:F-type H+-transporting ATPase subunit epsilon